MLEKLIINHLNFINMSKEIKKSSKTKQIKLDKRSKPSFEDVKPFLSVPLEITREKLRMMNMVDENIIISDPSNLIQQDSE